MRWAIKDLSQIHGGFDLRIIIVSFLLVVRLSTVNSNNEFFFSLQMMASQNTHVRYVENLTFVHGHIMVT